MWCPNCQADVAAEVAADNRRVRCASCGSTIDTARPVWTTEKTREARELLQRWSANRLFDDSAPATAAAETRSASLLDEPAPRREVRAAAGEPLSGGASMDWPAIRVDAPHAEPAFAHAAAVSAPLPREPEPVAAAPRVHAPQPLLPAPHFDVQSAIVQDEPRRANGMAVCGQLLAYLGVLGLTVGTTLVLWGYFGGPDRAHYAPTGWLISTMGQMLLFLGVVTLVSGGMEQTADEVRRKVDTLHTRLDRVERLAHHAASGVTQLSEAGSAKSPGTP